MSEAAPRVAKEPETDAVQVEEEVRQEQAAGFGVGNPSGVKLTAPRILQLQRTLGNQAVLRLLSNRPEASIQRFKGNKPQLARGKGDADDFLYNPDADEDLYEEEEEEEDFEVEEDSEEETDWSAAKLQHEKELVEDRSGLGGADIQEGMLPAFFSSAKSSMAQEKSSGLGYADVEGADLPGLFNPPQPQVVAPPPVNNVPVVAPAPLPKTPDELKNYYNSKYDPLATAINPHYNTGHKFKNLKYLMNQHRDAFNDRVSKANPATLPYQVAVNDINITYARYQNRFNALVAGGAHADTRTVDIVKTIENSKDPLPPDLKVELESTHVSGPDKGVGFGEEYRLIGPDAQWVLHTHCDFKGKPWSIQMKSASGAKMAIATFQLDFKQAHIKQKLIQLGVRFEGTPRMGNNFRAGGKNYDENGFQSYLKNKTLP